MTEIYKTWQGYQIRKKDNSGRWLYLSKVYKDRYTYVSDYTYAKSFSRDTALKHIKALERR